MDKQALLELKEANAARFNDLSRQRDEIVTEMVRCQGKEAQLDELLSKLEAQLEPTLPNDVIDMSEAPADEPTDEQ